MAVTVRHVAFFGATGGSTLACLDHALRDASLKCHALVRSESKLHGLLTERKVPDDGVSSRLSIVQGDAKDAAAVHKVLFPDELKGAAVDIIVSGIGGTLDMSNFLKPTLQDPRICEDATKTILAGLAQLKDAPSTKKPRLAVLSTTGISDAGRDIPLAMIPLYHWLLKVPHKDKAGMEQAIRAETEKPAAERIIANSLIVRPSLLTNGPATGIDKIRVGTGDKPAIGYTISRNDVGLWLFHNAIRGELDGVATITI